MELYHIGYGLLALFFVSILGCVFILWDALSGGDCDSYCPMYYSSDEAEKEIV